MCKVEGLSYPCSCEELDKFIEQYKVLVKNKEKNKEKCLKENFYLYVISFKDGHFYIGHTGQDFKSRMTKYFRREKTRNAPKNVAKHRPVDCLIKLIDVGMKTRTEVSPYEDALTIEYMQRYGYSKVRGGSLVGTDEKNRRTLWNKDYIVQNDKLYRMNKSENNLEKVKVELKEFSIIYEKQID